MSLMEEAFRWFGPDDPVPLAHIRQAGATAVFTSLHHVPYGALWPREEIRRRKEEVEAAGLRWAAVESVPVAENLKTNTGDVGLLIENYAGTLRNLAAEGVTTVIYNFMPVLDWVRTDVRHVLPGGAECLKYDPVHFAAFEIHALGREGAEADYRPEQVEAAARWWASLDEDARAAYIRAIIDVFPGVKLDLTLDDVRAMLARYHGMGPEGLRANLARFLRVVVPVAEEAGVRLAIHPDDPPFPLLGLPRVVSTADDIDAIFAMADSPANGLCLCTGSFGARADNDLPAMARRFGPRIHAAHLRNVRRDPGGGFHEAEHLGGSTDMAAVVRALLDEGDRRGGGPIPFRPDHGHTMMADLGRHFPNPGYSGIGRMRGLAELRGLMVGLRYAERAR